MKAMGAVDVRAIVSTVTAALAVLVAAGSIAAGIRSGAVRSLKFGNFLELRGARPIVGVATEEDVQLGRALVSATREDRPFETEQLGRYYAQVLAQARISFFFSLVFASLGFAVIVTAVFLYSGSLGPTVVQASAGLIMDTVAGLFFVQSRRAQEAMGDFLDKLRRDRDAVEARKLVTEVVDSSVRDALRVRLALHYSGIDASSFSFPAVSGASASIPKPNG